MEKQKKNQLKAKELIIFQDLKRDSLIYIYFVMPLRSFYQQIMIL